MQISPTNQSAQKEVLITIDGFRGGTNYLVDEARMDSKYAAESNNLIQVQDGLWKTRWGFNYYGQAITGITSIDGACEYVKTDGTTELIAVGGGKVWKSTDGGSWTEVTGATFTTGNKCYFLQIEGYLYITNTVDALARYNGTTLSTYTSVDAPAWAATPLARGGGLSSGTITYYYAVVALNDVGYTTPNTEQSITVNKDRSQWVKASNEYVTVDWEASVGATRYEIYFGDESGNLVYLGSTADTVWTDYGTETPNPYIETPNDNTTTAPKFGPMELSGNRIWATKDPDNKYRVYFSGSGQFMGYFSPFYGGGWIDLEKGGRDIPVSVVHYRTGKGDSVATVLCSSPEGKGSIWQVSLETANVDDVSFTVPAAYKIVGSIGSNAVRSVVKAGDNILFANKKGIYGLRNKPQMLNVLTTDELSQAIRPKYLSLKGSEIGDVCSYYTEGKIFFSAAEGSSNDCIFIFDMERSNWTWKWDKGVSQFLEYTDSAGYTHFLGIPTTGNQLWEISENIRGDFGGAINQSYLSPLIPVSKKLTDLLQLSEATVELGRPRGTVNFEVTGIGKDGSVATIGSKTLTNFGSNTGIGTDAPSGMLLSSTQTNTHYADSAWTTYLLDAPSVFTQATTKKTIKKRAKLYALQFHVYSNSADSEFTILTLQAKGRLIGRKAPSSWSN